MKIKKERLLNRFSGQISYKTSFALSVLLHGVVFLLLALLLNPIKLSHIDKMPLVVDFVSMPGKEAEGVASQLPADKNEPFLQKNRLVPARSYSPTASSQSNEAESTTNELADARYASESRTASKFDQPFFASVFVPPSVKFPRIDFAEPKLLPARIPLSTKHEKKLLKRVTKLTEKLSKQDFPDTTILVEANNQKFEIHIQHLPARSATELDQLLFDITTQQDGRLLSTQLRLRRLAFSNFAQLVDYWDPQVAVHNDVFEGRFHTNYAFAISRSNGIGPKFYGKVTTAALDVKTSGDFPITDDGSIFIGGIETGVKQIRLPKNFSPFADYSNLNRDQVLTLDEESWITFQRDGCYSWKLKTSPGVEHRAKIPAPAFFIVGNKGAKIHVKGTVNGKVLVYAADHIIIDNDLRYARPPDKFPGSDDYLGLVGERNIEVASPKVTGRGDLHVYAAIYARGWFRIPNLYGSGQATLYIYGSLSAGSLTATEPRYATHIRFDKRLEIQRPPHFPVTEQYEIVEWDKTWKVKEN